jgi:maltose O-acetyltransferase
MKQRFIKALRSVINRSTEFDRSSLRFCGKNVAIRSPCVIESAHNVEIGDDVSIASYLHIWGNAGVSIGPRTMIGSHVAITSATHEPDCLDMHNSLIEKRVVIENDVWLGTHCVIFPGVTIGQHSVVAAGSVVRDNVDPFTIVGGIPARLLRKKNIAIEDG